MIYSLDGTSTRSAFPHPSEAETEPEGLLAVGGDLTIPRLITAYQSGIFPWYSKGQPILWWSPNPRTVFYPDTLHVSRSLSKEIKRSELTLTVDKAFSRVMKACAEPRDEHGSWILPDMQRAYFDLHLARVAHSFELWRDDELVGGLYGVSLGKAIFGESMFSRVPNASKIVLVFIRQLMKYHGFHFLDAQVHNPHLQSMGAVQIDREQFLEQLANATPLSDTGDIWKTPTTRVNELSL